MIKVEIKEIAKYPDVGFYLKDDKNDVKRYIVTEELLNPIYMGYYPLSGKDRSKVEVSVKEGTYVYVTQYDYRYKTEISQVCNRGRKYNSRKFVIHVDYDTYNYLQSKGNPEDYILELIKNDYYKEENNMKKIGNIMMPESGKEAFEIANGSGKYEIERTLSGYYRLLCDDEVIHDDPAFEDVNEMESAYYFFAELIKEREG